MSRHLLSGGNNTLHSEQIRAEIQRFESVHPSIYQIYDLLNLLPDGCRTLSEQIREQIVAVEDAFVNSHEWTLSRSISEMKLGIVGTSQSGKTALVHRYLTGTYTPDESPEGGRFKKEVVIEGQSHLLLIRDEGQQHLDVQFCQWVDAVVFVFNVCSIQSYESIQSLAHEMSKFRNISDLPLVLVGTKDHISEKRARVITEDEGRQLAAQMKRCSYFETSSTYGTNVERVFKEACCKVIQFRIRSQVGSVVSQARTPTPTHSDSASRKEYQDPRYVSSSSVFAMPSNLRAPPPSQSARRTTTVNHRTDQPPPQTTTSTRGGSDRTRWAMLDAPYRMTAGVSPSASQKSVHSIANGGYSRSSAALLDSDPPAVNSYSIDSMSSTGTPLAGSNQVSASTSHLPTPSSTPNTQRKNRRISNIFRQKDHQEEKTKMIESLNLGIGRAIPIKQGTLYKKSSKSALNREWKKKYVCLYNDGRLTYHTNLKEYMDKTVHGKEMDLKLATIRITGRLHPHSHRVSTTAGPSTTTTTESGTPTLKSYEARRSDVGAGANSGDATSGGGSDDAIKENQQQNFSPQPQTAPNAGKKKRESRKAGTGSKHNEEEDECFEVINNCLMRWEFCAASVEERDEWIHAITLEIEKSLGKEVANARPNNRAVADRPDIAALRSVPGNERCADCNCPGADWASINLGIVICIECSGIHRNLGSHISKVRGLELDQWPVEHLAVMQAIGNDKANEMWECNLMNERKPTADSVREERERFIERKYVQKCYLKKVVVSDEEPLTSQLIAAVLARDVMALNVLLANGMSVEEVNTTTKDGRTVLHLAASIGSVELAQLLIWHNADPHILDNNGRSCLFYARSNGFREVFDMLVTAGLSPNYGLPQESDYLHMPEFSAMGSTSNRDYSLSGDDTYGSRRISIVPPQVPRRYLPQQPELDETSVI